MRAIISLPELDSLAIKVRELVSQETVLPDTVINERLKYFHFITSDEILSPILFNHLKRYLIDLDERSMFVVGLGESGLIYSAIEVLSTDTEDEYLTTVNGFEDSVSIEMHASKILLIFSESKSWVIYGDKEPELSVCGFADIEKAKLFERIYSEDLIGDVHLAADYAFSDSEANMKIFIDKYS